MIKIRRKPATALKTLAEEVAPPPSEAKLASIIANSEKTFKKVNSAPKIISIDEMDNYLSKMNDYVLYMKSLEARNTALEMENTRVNQENTQLRIEMSQRRKNFLKCAAQARSLSHASLAERVRHDLKAGLGNLSAKNRLRTGFSVKSSKSRQVSLDRLFSEPNFRQKKNSIKRQET